MKLIFIKVSFSDRVFVKLRSFIVVQFIIRGDRERERERDREEGKAEIRLLKKFL